jgi:N-acetylneuraminic acid mutarotase
MARESHAATAVNGTVYVIGGYDNALTTLSRVDAYDVAGNNWHQAAALPAARAGMGVAAANGIVYAMGGTDGTYYHGNVAAYDPSTNAWTAKAAMPMPRVAFGTDAVNGIVYVVGGVSFPPVDTSFFDNSLWAYDPGTDQWSTLAPAPTRRNALGVAAINGILYAVGGAVDSMGYEQCLSTLEAYDPASNSWSTKAPMPIPGTQCSGSVAAVNGLLYVVGGWDKASAATLNTVEVYDPATNSWTSRDAMPTARSSAAVAVANGVLFVVDGWNPTSGVVHSNEAYLP